MGYVPVDVNEAIRRECLRRGYSQRTIETYQECVKKFLDFSGKTIDQLGKKDVLDFLYNQTNLCYDSLTKYSDGFKDEKGWWKEVSDIDENFNKDNKWILERNSEHQRKIVKLAKKIKIQKIKKHTMRKFIGF